MTERDWVPCHRRLLKGAKKGWPRAVRFILLELCHEARPTDGTLEFPVEWDTLTAVHDRLGGDRKEIRKALTFLQIPDATGAQVIQIERDETKHRLKIVKWETWSGPKSGAERVELHRKRALEKRETLQAPRDVTPTGSDSTGSDRREESSAAPVEVKTRSNRPPPPPPHPDPDIDAVAESIRREPRLVAVHYEAKELAERAMPVGLRKPVSWLQKAVGEAARDTPSGEPGHLTHKRVAVYLERARAPREEEKPPGIQYREFKREPKVVPVDAVKQAALAAKVAGIGRGGSST